MSREDEVIQQNLWTEWLPLQDYKTKFVVIYIFEKVDFFSWKENTLCDEEIINNDPD